MDIPYVNNFSDEVKNLLIEIKFIASCPEKKKISFALRKYIEPNVWSLDGFKRMISFETHSSVMQHIENVIADTAVLLQAQKTQHGSTNGSNGSNKILELFIVYLTEMHDEGLAHLYETYKDDPDAFTHLSVIKDQLHMLIETLKPVKPEHDRKND